MTSPNGFKVPVLPNVPTSMTSTTGTHPKVGISSKAQGLGNHASTPLDDISFQWDGFTPSSQALPTSMKDRPHGKNYSLPLFFFFLLYYCIFAFFFFSLVVLKDPVGLLMTMRLLV